MKKTILFFVFLMLIILGRFYYKKTYNNSNQKLKNATQEVKKLTSKDLIHSGDLIFQTSLSGQSKAIQVATKSKYSHCGLIFKKENDNQNWYVIEAVQPVKWTSLEKWIARGENGKYVIKRLKQDAILDKSKLLKLRGNAEKYLGKNYDLTFEWSDDKIYCSELLWKVYKTTTGIEIGKLQKLREFDLTNKIVKAKMKERYGDNLPLNELVISPKALFESTNLKTIQSN